MFRPKRPSSHRALPLRNKFPLEEPVWSGWYRHSNNQVERLRIVREGIAGYPRYEGINQLKNIEKEILNASLSQEIATAYPGEQQSVKVNYKNLTGITLQLYKVNLPVTSAVLQNRTTHFESNYARLQLDEHFSLKPTTDYFDTVGFVPKPDKLQGLFSQPDTPVTKVSTN